MRKSITRSAKPTTDGGFLPASDDTQESWFRREWRLIALLAIMIVAFLIRFIFAFGVSAGNDFALSGGTGASSHAHIIESILNGSFAFTDPALNYPYGSVVVYPVFMDVILAGVSGIVSMFGISTSTAVAGTLAFSAPIFAALTCWPVYLIGRKMFNDEKIGLLAALLYAFFALMIMTTVFSNGTEFAFVGFLFAFMIYFLLKALDSIDKDQPTGLMGVFANKGVLKYTIITGVLFLLIALSWSQFRVILLMLLFFLVAQAIIDRIRGREVMPTVMVYSVVILIGLLIGLLYYIPAGLWDLAFSGPFILGIMTVALSMLFALTAKRSWVLMIPVIIIIAVAVFVVLAVAAPDTLSAVLSGNSLYTNSLMASLASQSTTTSISSMAAFFGWVTVWLPLVMFLYMLYKYRKNADSRKYTFIMLWILAMFCIGWFSSSYAAVAGAGFAVASAALILMVMRMTDLKSYFNDMKGNGVKFALKKTLKPIPLVTVIAIVALIITPNLIYAVDASTPTNSEDGGYFGGLGYTIMTDDVNSINKMWSDFQDVDKEGAIIAWLGNSTGAVSDGGFDSVSDAYGGGASVMSAVVLANSSAAATSAMAVRLLMSKNLYDYQQMISNAGLSFDKIKGYIDDPASAVQYIKDNVDIFGGISPDVTEENAVYLAITNYMTSTISEPSIDALYDKICEKSGESINYVAVDMTMLPLYYNDNSYFSTIAYLGSYAIGAYGAPTQFFSYDTTTGYATYTDAMYTTFFWKSLIGMSPTEAGYTSVIPYLNALAASDGSVKANPAYGLSNYKIAYWHVYYNPDNNATGTSDGWVDMDALGPDGAIALQSRQGGLINYVNGVVVLEYDTSVTNTVSGTVNYESSNGNVRAEGIQVSVFVESASGSSVSGETGYVKRSTAFTDSNGRYEVSVPNDGTSYYVVFSSGTTTIATGSIIETRWNMTQANANLNIPVTGLSGTVNVKDGPYTQSSYVVIEGKASGMKYQSDVNTTTGGFSFSNIMPDIYTIIVYSPNGTTINSSTVTVNAGVNSGYQISATSGTITVTVTTDVGANAPNGTVIAAKDTLTGIVYTGTVTDGKAVIQVVPATYIVYATGSKVSTTNPSATVSSGGSSTATLTVFDAKNISISGAPAGGLVSIMSYGFITSTSASSVAVPMSGGSTNETYTAYAVSGSNVYYGVTNGTSISLSQATGYNVSGTVKDSSGGTFTGTVSFIMSNGATFIFSTDADGKFNVMLPSGTYTMYIFGSSSVSLSTVTISGDQEMGDISTLKSRDLTVNVNYKTNMSSPTTRGIGFVDLTITLTVNDHEYSIVAKTDSSGKAVLTLPQNVDAKVTSAGFNTAKFSMPARSIDNSSVSTTESFTLEADSQITNATINGYVKPVSVTNGTTVKLTLYNNSNVNYTGTSFANIQPGQYTAVIDGSTTGQYFNGTIYVYPGQSGSLNIEATSVAKVTLTGISDKDEIIVTPMDDESGKYYSDADPFVYYLQKGKSFYFTVISEDKEKIAYATAPNVSSPLTLNLTGVPKAEIKGYVGVIADGTLTMTYSSSVSGDVKVPFTVSGGTFDITVPSGTAMTLTAELSQTIGGTDYTYKESKSLTADQVKDGADVRFHSTTVSSVSTVPELTGTGFNFADGRGSFTLSIKNTGTTSATYNVTAGSAWVLDKAYSISVGAGSTASILIEGRYDADTVGAGNPNLSVMVASINGTAVGTYVLDAAAFPTSGPNVTTTDTYVDVSEIKGTNGASADAVNSFEYMYAVTITNNDNYLKQVSVSATMIGANSNWSMVYSDEDGGNIASATGPNTFNVNGFGSTVIYVKVMSTDASDKDVPAVNISVTMNTPGQSLKTNSNGTSVGTHVDFNGREAQSAKMETQDMSATGDNIFSEQSGIPILTLALIVLCIILLIAMVWFGMKKGVFVRRR